VSDELVRVESIRNGIFVVTMQRASKRNALNVPMLDQLNDAFEKLERDPANRVVIFRGDGPVFCAGLDLAEAEIPDIAERSAEGVRSILNRLQSSPLIVVGAIRGAAYAGGAGLLAACDLVVASDDLKIGFPEVRRGLVAALVWGILTRRIRGGDLRELLLLAEPIDAERARQMGLVHWTVPGDRVYDLAYDVATKILAGGPESIRETKRLLGTDPIRADFEFLRALHERVRHSAEAKEGLAAFREKRPPGWCQNT
jgi:methylglutaconyl-CoA hydratase